MMLSEELQNELVEMVEAANLESPEQVCDWVLEAAERGGREAAVAELRRAAEADISRQAAR